MPIPTSTKPIQRTLMREQVYETLLNLIISHELAPGEKLVDKDLAAQLGVSRTPIRESLRRLEDEGFVATAANQWTRVAPIDMSQGEDIYPIICELETLALNTVEEHLDASRIALMEKANDEFEIAVQDGDTRNAMRLDTLFHSILVESGGNQEIAPLLHVLKLKVQRLEFSFFQYKDIATKSVEEHQSVIAHLRENDMDRARNALRKNWLNGLVRFRDAVEKSRVSLRKHD